MPHGGRVTVSIGVAEGTLEDDGAWRALYHHADTALYAAKRQGRDRIVHTRDLAPGDLPSDACTLPQQSLPERKVA